MSRSSNLNWFFLLLIIVALAFGANMVLSRPDQRSPGQKVSDAIDELPDGVDKAARQLKDRTPGDKLKDAADDAKDSINKATNNQ